MILPQKSAIGKGVSENNAEPEAIYKL